MAHFLTLDRQHLVRRVTVNGFVQMSQSPSLPSGRVNRRAVSRITSSTASANSRSRAIVRHLPKPALVPLQDENRLGRCNQPELITRRTFGLDCAFLMLRALQQGLLYDGPTLFAASTELATQVPVNRTSPISFRKAVRSATSSIPRGVRYGGLLGIARFTSTRARSKTSRACTSVHEDRADPGPRQEV